MITKYKKHCPTCKKIFYHEDKRQKYCSRECYFSNADFHLGKMAKIRFKGKPNLYLSKEFPNSVINRYLSGESACAIAKDFDTCNSVVIRFLNRNGVETHNPNERKDIDDYIIQEYPKGKSMRQIAKELSVSHGTIKRHIEQIIDLESRGMPSGELHHAYNPHLQFKDRCRKYIDLATDWQQQIFERDDYTCWICGKRGGDLNAHHIIPFNELVARFIREFGEDFEKFKQTEWVFDTSIGITLCKKCHYELHYDN